MLSLYARLFVLLLGSLFYSHAFSIPDFWKHSAYAVECSKTPVKDVLEDFSRNFGVSLVLSGKLSGRCDNWTRSDNAEDFLNLLGNQHQFQWFVYKGNLYVSPNSDTKTKRLDASAEFKEALSGLGLYQEKFGWGELSNEEVVLITGPSRYVNLVAQFTQQESAAKRRIANGDVHIFKLKHAPVSDRKIMIRTKEVVIPGVSSILKGLLEEKTSIERDEETVNKLDVSSRNVKTKVYIESDVRTNSILIRAPEKDYQFYKKIIDDLDVPSDLIEIDAIIVDINREKLKEIGANFSFFDNDGVSGLNSATTGFGAESISQALNVNATILIDNLGKFYSSLKALESKGDASIIANTSILTMNNQPAVIDLSETVFIQSVGERVIDVQPVTAGTLLNVTPSMVDSFDGNKIKLLVDIEDGKLSSSTGAGSSTPIIQKTSINTKAVIDQNRSLVIGGYHVQKTTNSSSGVPLLQDIPLLGSLFSTKSREKTHLERLFILTPRVSPTHHNPEDYSSTGSADLISKALSKIKSRWDNASRSYVEKTERLLSDLAAQRITDGYTLSDIDDKLTFECKQNGIKFDFTGGQKVVGRGLTAYIGLVTNTLNSTVLVDESACSGRGLIGVSLFPKVTLSAQERTEIFVSLESARMDVNERASLIFDN